MEVTRHTLFDGALLQAVHVIARPLSFGCGAIERPTANNLVLPLAGVFAHHAGPRREMIATPHHALLLAADAPYRISFPAHMGDECLVLRFSDEALSRLAPEAVRGSRFDAAAHAPQLLLPAQALLARSQLWRQLRSGEADPLALEEAGAALLAGTLRLACKERRPRTRVAAGGPARHRAAQMGRVLEAIAQQPERKWTLGALADLACASPFHFAHVFRKEMGTSVYHYVLRARLAKALDVVLDADTELTAIALDAGFTSHSHFTARFRALFGITPVDLRRNASRRAATELRKIVIAKDMALA